MSGVPIKEAQEQTAGAEVSAIDRDGRAAVARAFQTLWHSLTTTRDGPRLQEERRVLIDAVRDALDRGEQRLAIPATQPSGILQIGEIVANTFILREILSVGPCSIVYRASHRDLQKDFALKTLVPEHASSPAMKAMMMREAQHHTILSHPGIVPVRMMLRLADGRPCLISDFVTGPTLAERANSGPLDAAALVVLAAGILDGLACIHGAGLVHADLSADNIILADGQASMPRILDLGAALPIGQRHGDHDLAFVGRKNLVEEPAASGPLHPGTDLIALGRILQRLQTTGHATADNTALHELIQTLLADRHAEPGRNPAAEIGSALLAKQADISPEA